MLPPLTATVPSRASSVAAYDFIVVGAGSAGCAVAGRLATRSSSRVLLIEAGGSDRRLTVRAPLAFGRQFGTSLDWAYESEPEPGCANRRIAQPRGRVLGGTSAMNGQRALDDDRRTLRGFPARRLLVSRVINFDLAVKLGCADSPRCRDRVDRRRADRVGGVGATPQ